MLHSLLIAVGGIFALMAFWLAVQQLARKHSPGRTPGCDMLEHLVHGCANCREEACAKKPQA